MIHPDAFLSYVNEAVELWPNGNLRISILGLVINEREFCRESIEDNFDQALELLIRHLGTVASMKDYPCIARWILVLRRLSISVDIFSKTRMITHIAQAETPIMDACVYLKGMMEKVKIMKSAFEFPEIQMTLFNAWQKLPGTEEEILELINLSKRTFKTLLNELKKITENEWQVPQGYVNERDNSSKDIPRY